MAPQDRSKGDQEAGDNQTELHAPQLPALQLSPRARTVVQVTLTILGALYIALVIFQYYKLVSGQTVRDAQCWEYGC